MSQSTQFPSKVERRCSAPPPESRYNSNSTVGAGVLNSLTNYRFKRLFQRRTSQYETPLHPSPYSQEDATFCAKTSCIEECSQAESSEILICPKCSQDIRDKQVLGEDKLRKIVKLRQQDENSSASDCWDVEDLDSGAPTSSLISGESSTRCSSISGSGAGVSLAVGVGVTDRLRQMIRIHYRRFSTTSSQSRCDSGHGEEDLIKPIHPGPPLTTISYRNGRCHSVAEKTATVLRQKSLFQTAVCILCNRSIPNDEIYDWSVKRQILASSSCSTDQESCASNRLSSIASPNRQSLQLADVDESQCVDNVTFSDVFRPLKPPKEPHKLPLCQANSGITFADNKIKLADQFRLRSSSLCPYQKRQRTIRSKSVFDSTPDDAFWASKQQLWLALCNVQESNRLTKALFEENQLFMGYQPMTSRSMSRVSESSRYITISRTPCGRRSSRNDDENRTCENVDEYSAGFTAMFQHASIYETLPESSKLIVVCSDLPMDRGYYALLNNNVNAAPVWNEQEQRFDGVFCLSHFIAICQKFSNINKEEHDIYKRKTIGFWLEQIKEYTSPVIFLQPDQHLHDAIDEFREHESKYIIVHDPLSGNVLNLITPQRLLRYLWSRCNQYVLKPAQHWVWQSIEQASAKLSMSRFGPGVSDNTRDGSWVTMDTTIAEILNIYLTQKKDYGTPVALPVFHGVEKSLTDCRFIDLLTENDCVEFLINFPDTSQPYFVKDCLRYKNRMKLSKIWCHSTDSVCVLMDTFCGHDVECVPIMNSVQPDQLYGLVYLDNLLQYLVCDEHC